MVDLTAWHYWHRVALGSTTENGLGCPGPDCNICVQEAGIRCLIVRDSAADREGKT